MVFLFVLGSIILLLTLSKIQIEIQNLIFINTKKPHIQPNYQIILKWRILGKITILKSIITNKKFEEWKNKEKNRKLGTVENKIDKKIIEAIKHAKIEYKNVNLKIELGTENACLTSLLIPAISTSIAIWLRKKIKENENQTFIIQPIYQNRNLINIYFSGIFETKTIHIINIIYILNKKGRVKRHERASNRRTYDYSYE